MVDGDDYDVVFYADGDGFEPVRHWLRTMKDKEAKRKIEVRLLRLHSGQFGDVKPVGRGVHEIRIFVGKGYRVYFANVGRKLIMLLCGGDKQSKAQQNRDIATAKAYLNDYKNR